MIFCLWLILLLLLPFEKMSSTCHFCYNAIHLCVQHKVVMVKYCKLKLWKLNLESAVTNCHWEVSNHVWSAPRCSGRDRLMVCLFQILNSIIGLPRTVTCLEPAASVLWRNWKTLLLTSSKIFCILMCTLLCVAASVARLSRICSLCGERECRESVWLPFCVKPRLPNI